MAKSTTERRADLDLFGELLQAAFRDPEGTPDRLTVISLTDEEQDRLITPRRLELIRTLRDHGTLTISELAEEVGRRLDVVSRDLHALVKHDIIKLEQKGRSKWVRLATDLVLLYVAAPREHAAV